MFFCSSEHLSCRGDDLKLADPSWSDLSHVDGLPGPGESHGVRAGELRAPAVHHGVLIGEVQGQALPSTNIRSEILWEKCYLQTYVYNKIG